MPKPKRNDDDDEHFIDRYEREKREAEAAERAIARAQRPRSEANETVRRRYARQALERETELLASTLKSRRNDQLNISGMKLFQLVAAGYLDETEVESALESACRANGHLQEDGRKMVVGTIRSAKKKGMSEPRDLSEVGVHNDSEYIARPVQSRIKSQDLAEIEGDFWTRRESLRSIYLSSMAGLLSPWAVLACCAAKALTLCPPHVTLPALVGLTPGSLNWFAILAGGSGFGKTTTMEAVDQLIKSTVQQRNIGSGEGMIEAYKRPKSDEAPGNYEGIMFIADEIETLAAHKSRTGSTTLATLRSAFSGATLGASTKASNNFHLLARSYRMTLIVGAQPGRAHVLTDDADAGTPQRFMWFPALDDRVEENTPMAGSELDVPTALSSDDLRYDFNMPVPDVVERAVVRARVKVMKGQGNTDDSHKLFVREKFAYALCLLDGRTRMTDEDWELSGVAMNVSDFTRDWVLSSQEEADELEAEKVGRTTGLVAAAAETAKAGATDKATNRVATNLLKFIKEAGTEGITQRELHYKVAGRDRGLFIAALNRLESSDVAMKMDRRWYLFDAQRREEHNDEDF